MHGNKNDPPELFAAVVASPGGMKFSPTKQKEPLTWVEVSGKTKALHKAAIIMKRGCCKTKVEQQPLFLLKSIRGGVFWGKDVEKLPVF